MVKVRNQRYRCREGDTPLKLPSSPTGLVISDAEVSTSFGLVQEASSSKIAALRAGATLLSSLHRTHPAKFPLDRKEQINAFIVLIKALIKSPR